MSSANSVFVDDCNKLIANGKTYEYPGSVEQAYSQANKYHTFAKAHKPSSGSTVATTTMIVKNGKTKGSSASSNTVSSKSNKQKTNSSSTSGGTKPDKGKALNLKFPCSTCNLLGKPHDHSHFPNNCPHKSEVEKVLSGSDNGETSLFTTIGFDSIPAGNSRASSYVMSPNQPKGRIGGCL